MSAHGLLEGILPAGKTSMVALMFSAFEDGAAAGPVPELVVTKVVEQAALAKKLGIDVVLIGGTTDEWPSLTVDERVEVARAWRAAIPAGSAARPRLLLHTGATSLADARRLAALAVELAMDGVLVSAPPVYRAPDIETHCESIAAALGPLSGTAIPAFYYHFPSLYNDDLPLPEMVAALRERCPNIVGAKLSGVRDMAVVRALSALEGFAVIATGIGALATRPRGWICYPWEAAAARQLVATEGVTSAETAKGTVLDALRTEVIARRLPSRPGAYQISAEKPFMSAWSGIEVGPCRLPLPTAAKLQFGPLLDDFAARGLLRRP